MRNQPARFALRPTDLPPLSDSAAVEILDFLYEGVFRFEAHYDPQVRRFYDQQRDLRAPPPIAPTPGGDDPFQLVRRASAPRLPSIRFERPQRADPFAICGWPQ